MMRSENDVGRLRMSCKEYGQTERTRVEGEGTGPSFTYRSTYRSIYLSIHLILIRDAEGQK
jgi:hypothetical protein